MAVGALLWSRRERGPQAASGLPGQRAAYIGSLPGRWVWPVGIWNGRKPQISDGFAGTRRSPTSGDIIPHGGVDIMYRRTSNDPWRAGSPNASPNYVLPDHRAALAASDGRVWSASYTRRGWTVVLDHGPRKVATYYTHMSELLVVPKQEVRAGQPLGIIGADPLDDAHLKHLHFEVWLGGPKDRVDPELLMKAWEQLPDPGDQPALLARNARNRASPGARFATRQRTPRR